MLKKILQAIQNMSYILNKPQKILGVCVFVLTCIGSVLECLGVSVVIPMVNMIMNPDSIIKNELFIRIFGEKEIEYKVLVLWIVLFVIAVYLLKNTFFVFLSWVRIKYSSKIQREISIRMMESYMSRGYQFFLDNTIGELNRGVSGDPTAIYNTLHAVFKFLSDILTVLLICIFMVFSDWLLSAAMFGVAILCVIIIYLGFRRQMYKSGIKYRDYTAKVGQTLVESFQGIKDILILRKQRNFVDEYEKNQICLQSAQCAQVVGAESPAYIIEGVCISGLMLAVGIRVISGNQAAEFVSTLAAFAVGAFRILPSLGRIAMVLNTILANVPGINAVYENIVEAERYEKEHPETNFVKKNLIEVRLDAKQEINKSSVFERQLSVQNITFKYHEREANILEGLSLTIDKGKSIALIGASGAGKSTLIDILLGLLIPQKGKILIDNKLITENPDEWSTLIGYVPQTVFLTSGSIKQNIAFGEKEEFIDEERVRDCLKQAELLQFVEALPNGMETYVGDRGVRLSGGQRQRIAIARALYHQPQILVLDEATSALDNDTELAIMSAIEALQGQVTLIIVAHRLTTIRKCDIIYEVRDKGIVKRNKTEVLRECGIEHTASLH